MMAEGGRSRVHRHSYYRSKRPAAAKHAKLIACLSCCNLFLPFQSLQSIRAAAGLGTIFFRVSIGGVSVIEAWDWDAGGGEIGAPAISPLPNVCAARDIGLQLTDLRTPTYRSP